MHDVIIVGGGPIGLSTAADLADKGLDVVVLEKKDEIGHQIVCSGIIGQEAFAQFELPEDPVLHEIRRIKVISPSAGLLDYEHPFPLARVVDRDRFDRALGERARNKGVKINLSSDVIEVETDRSHLRVTAKQGRQGTARYAGRFLVMATGIHYGLHKKLGLGVPQRFLNGVQCELEVPDLDSTRVYFGNELAPGAFGWAVPTDKGRAKIGLITERDPNGYIYRLIDKVLPGRRKTVRKDQVRHKVIPQGLVSGTYSDRILCIGEAAGQVKTTTGGGIYYGLLSSRIAVKIILRSFQSGKFDRIYLAEYERQWKNRLKKEITTGRRFRKIYSMLSDERLEQIFQIAVNNGVIPLLKAKGRFDWHSEMLLTLIGKSQFWPVLKTLTNPASDN